MSESKSSKQTSLLSFFGQSKKQHTKKSNSQTTKSENDKKRPVAKRRVEATCSGVVRTTLKSNRKNDLLLTERKNEIFPNKSVDLVSSTTETCPQSPICSSQITPTPLSSTKAVTPPSITVHNDSVKEPPNDTESESHTIRSLSSSKCRISTEITHSETSNQDVIGEECDDMSVADDKKVQQTENDSVSASDAEEFEPELSEYELLRKRNIERNNKRLAALGLIGNPWGSAGENSTQEQEQKKKKQRRRKVGGDTTKHAASVPTRRSTRNRRSVLQSSMIDGSISETTNSKFDTVNTSQKIGEEMQQEEEQEEQYTVSPVVQYAISASEGDYLDESIASSSTSEVLGDIASLKPLERRLLPPNGLSAIYSLQFYPTDWCPRQRPDDTWIVGAGKSGIVSLWDCNWSNKASDSTMDGGDTDIDGIDSILSWKAHGGRWVADVQFLPTPNHSNNNSSSLGSKSPPSRLLTAANDGCVCLWDLTAVSVQTGAPKMLCKTGKELHRSGIFAMDVCLNSTENPNVCTGSKDKTVAVTQLDSIARGASGRPIWVSDYHCSKVGAVAFQGKASTLLASASDDGTVAIHDYRVDGQNGKNKVVAEISDAHNRPHSVVWNPLSEHEIMTAGHDNKIFTFDIRQGKHPLASFHGHVPSNSRCKKIHHPIFFNPCSNMANSEQFILTGGDGSRSLSMFRNKDSDRSKEQLISVYSRGKLPADCGDAGSLATQGNRVAAVVDGGEILLLTPQIKH